MLADFLQCCNRPASSEFRVVTIDDSDCCGRTGEGDLKVIHRSIDILESQLPPVEPIPSVASRGGITGAANHLIGPPVDRFHAATGYSLPVMTPCQRDLKDRVRLPAMMKYPVPEECSDNDPEDIHVATLLRIFQGFVVDMHRGVYMTQVSSTDEHSDMHCQLQDDLLTLKVDQGSGCVIEFPLTAVTRIYRILRDISKSSSILSRAEHMVVVEFTRRKLVLVFGDMQDAKSFIMCMELLVRFAQEIGPPKVVAEASRAPSQWRANSRSSTQSSRSKGTYQSWPPQASVGEGTPARDDDSLVSSPSRSGAAATTWT